MEEIKNVDSPRRAESSEISAGSTREVYAHKGVIDTAVPFDSVKAAANMFGGVIGWRRARKIVDLVNHADSQSEFEKVQEEIPKYKKQSEAAHAAKLQVQEELESTKKLIQELKDRLEKTETEVAQAKHDSELSDSAKVKREESIEELNSVKEELKSLHVGCHRLLTERDSGITNAPETAPELDRAKKELEEIKATVEKAKDEVNNLRHAALSLKTEIEQEANSISALKQKEGVAFTSVSSLEAEIGKMQSELELVLAKEKEAREKMEQLPGMIEQATNDANQAKSIADLACEELRNEKEELEQATASVSATEAKLLAAINHTEAAKSSEALASGAVKAMQESEELPIDDRVNIKLEEFYTLSMSASNAEMLGNQKVITAAQEIEEAKNSELVELNKLEQVQKELEEKKEALKEAEEMAKKANEEKMVVEQELKDCSVENGHRRIASDVTSHSKKKEGNKGPAKHASSLSCPDFNDHNIAEVKPRKKKSFFPRIVMFLARKKAQSLK